MTEEEAAQWAFEKLGLTLGADTTQRLAKALNEEMQKAYNEGLDYGLEGKGY